MDSQQQGVVEPEEAGAASLPLPSAPALIADLPPKGACWYCDKPLDAVRRFCNKSCSAAYAEEAQYE